MKIHKIKIGDTVMVRAGKFRTKTGQVSRLERETGQVWIAGINIVKKHQKKSQLHPRGGIVEKHLPMPIGKVMVIDQKSKKPTRVGFKQTAKAKERIAKKSGETIVIGQPATNKK